MTNETEPIEAVVVCPLVHEDRIPLTDSVQMACARCEKPVWRMPEPTGTTRPAIAPGGRIEPIAQPENILLLCVWCAIEHVQDHGDEEQASVLRNLAAKFEGPRL